ncbi:MAG: DUF1329 domain-containing protein [Candidatus Binataceae bacterium]
MRKAMFAALCSSLAAMAIVLAFTAASAQEADTIPPGTVITTQNWQKYKPFMQYGIQQLFAGKYFWKFPADFQMKIGPTHDYPLPAVFTQNTEKYSNQVKIINLPDGGHSISGYVAGLPFAKPSGSLKGWEILVNSWFAYVPHIQCTTSNHVYLVDHFGNRSQEVTQTVYRQFSYISDPHMPPTDPEGPGIYYAEYTRVLSPEQSKYTTQLALYYANPSKEEDLFLFIPALRRTLRLSSAARCSPFVGTDWTQDDVKQEFNGGIVRFNANFIGNRKFLAITKANIADSDNLANYYQPMLFPGPRVGSWEVRDSYLIDVRRIPSQSAGYCFGKRMLYVDAQTWIETWCDLYDANMKFWKPFSFQTIVWPQGGNGPKVMYSGDYIVGIWDEQSDHASAWIAHPPFGTNAECKNLGGINYTDTKLYSTVGGLASIMQ